MIFGCTDATFNSNLVFDRLRGRRSDDKLVAGIGDALKKGSHGRCRRLASLAEIF